MKLLALSLCALTIGGGLLIGRVLASRERQQATLAPPSALPAPAIEILAAHPFVVDEPFVHEWRAEKPLVQAGYLLALKVDAALARTRQTYEPVLFVGEQTAERCNATENGDVLVVLVPAPLDAEGRVELDLDSAPIWFGALELPERVDAARIRSELASARANGIGPAPQSERARLASGAGDAIRARTRWELQPYVDDLIAELAPRR